MEVGPRVRRADGALKPPQAASVRSRGGERCGRRGPVQHYLVSLAEGLRAARPIAVTRRTRWDVATSKPSCTGWRSWSPMRHLELCRGYRGTGPDPAFVRRFGGGLSGARRGRWALRVVGDQDRSSSSAYSRPSHASRSRAGDHSLTPPPATRMSRHDTAVPCGVCRAHAVAAHDPGLCRAGWRCSWAGARCRVWIGGGSACRIWPGSNGGSRCVRGGVVGSDPVHGQRRADRGV